MKLRPIRTLTIAAFLGALTAACVKKEATPPLPPAPARTAAQAGALTAAEASRNPGAVPGSRAVVLEADPNALGQLAVAATPPELAVEVHCDRAYVHLARRRTADEAAGAVGKDALPLPPPKSFIAACAKLPADAARCLDPTMRAARRAHCASALAKVGDRQVAKFFGPLRKK